MTLRLRRSNIDTMTSPLRVLVAGGGIAGLEALLALRETAGPRLSLTLVEPRDAVSLLALGPAEPFGAGRPTQLRVGNIAARVGARMVRGAVRGIDTSARLVLTETGDSIPNDALLIAVGGRQAAAIPEALTWWPMGDRTAFARMLTDLERGAAGSVAFVVPPQCVWSLPAYELALLTARRLARRGRSKAKAKVTIVTPEAAPLEVFGPEASAVVARELDDARIAFRGGRAVTLAGTGPFAVKRAGSRAKLEVDRAVALPHAVGPEVPGVDADADGFLDVDEHCRVRHTPAVWAAGDATSHRPCHGGLAAEQADCAAEDIAARAGAPISPRPYRPVLRAELMTGRGTLWLRRDLGDPDDAGAASELALWPPRGKVAARLLGAELALGEPPRVAVAQRG
jgi:sulfide:quinone oxidoreductase